ncbi:chromatin structure-remodeling complex subunit RSC7 [Microbotryomycetes sp. JL201]|nr:chromatin structure-remodeling complex subunit RSC7 [Microbotryomycetes sp. JL201]
MDFDSGASVSEAGQTPAASSSGAGTAAIGFASEAVSRAASTQAGDNASEASNASDDAHDTQADVDDDDDDDDNRDDVSGDDRSVTSAQAEDEDEGEDEQGDEDDDEPRSVDEDDLDPINSGAQTPASRPALSQVPQPLSGPLAEQATLPGQLPSTHAQAPVHGANLAQKAHAPALPKSKALNFHKKRDTIEIKGKVYAVQDDEIVLDDDPRGETKIDANGQLLGGREWKLRTFTSGWRKNPDKLYILSIDVARAAGFRDSLYFFRKFPMVHKVTVGPQEKEGLISQGKLPTMLRSRAVTFMAARNVYKVMGAIFVKDGKYVFDDYYEDKSLAAGHQPGEPAVVVPYDQGQTDAARAVAFADGPGAAASNKHRPPGMSGRPDDYVAGSVASLWPSIGILPLVKAWDPIAKKARPPPHLTEENWMLEYAKSAQEYNKYLGTLKRFHEGPVYLNVGLYEEDEEDSVVDNGAGPASTVANGNASSVKAETAMDVDSGEGTAKRRKLDTATIRGFYDPTTNVAHVSQATQSSRAEWCKVDRVPQLAQNAVSRHGQVYAQKLGRAACQAGLSTLDVIVDRPSAQHPVTMTGPDSWDFHAGEGWQSRFA